MADIIQLLPDNVANQIAAGEVVQRPASVVKELLENAVDAGATEIKLIIKDSGKTLIRVIDNGIGMSETDARLCFERHATSKIRQAEDLFKLHTKGFRGEALASIAAIAHVVLVTKQEKKQEDSLGTQIKIEGTSVSSQEVVTAPKGTSVSVKNLFFNIPARRNFLKSNQVELRHIIDEFQRIALAHSNIAFSMYHDSNEVYLLKKENVRQRIVNIFGGKTNEKLVPIEEETSVTKISGFVAKPEFAKKRRGEQFFFVNNRFVKSSYLNHAVTSAFEGLIAPKSYPSYFLYLQLPPDSIDINIHPTKTEIKFDDEQALYAIIRATVKHSLGQYSVAPVLDFERDPNLDTPYDYKHKNIDTPPITVDTDYNPFKDTSKKEHPSSFIPGHYKKETPAAGWESLYSEIENITDDENKGLHDEEITTIQYEKESTTADLFPDTDNSAMQTNASHQIQRKYIVSAIKSGMVIVDQNRAHQRILYEEFLENISLNENPCQQLLLPLQMMFSKPDILLIGNIKDTLTSVGFQFEKIQGETLVITGIPANVSEKEASEILEQLVEDIKAEIPGSGFNPHDFMARSIAKSLAVKSGTALEVKEQEAILNRLFACKEPDISPHGKATFTTITIDELDKKFL